jgi:8-oxo-dGTP diphosphatase
MSSLRTRILSPGSIEEARLIYVVIGARQHGRWLFVRHAGRITWEMPAGHIEPDESADQAAVRELYEETGTVRSSLDHLCDYEVSVRGRTEYGRLYRAEILEREERLEYEIAEVILSQELPESLTYPEVQTILFDRVRQF